MYLKLAPNLSRCSFLAAAISFGLLNNSIALKLSVFAATIIPLLPIFVPPAATACQECAAVPGTQVAVPKPTVGTVKETSPTSVEPPALAVVLYGAIAAAVSWSAFSWL